MDAWVLEAAGGLALMLVGAGGLLWTRRARRSAPPPVVVPEEEALPAAYAGLYAQLERIHADKAEPRHWLLRTEDGHTKSLPVPERYLRAMLARARTQHGGNIGRWWGAYRDKVQMHADSKAWLEARILDPERFTEDG